MNIEANMEVALASDASMAELLEAMQDNPIMQRALRMAWRVGFSAGALHATREASKMLRKEIS